MRLSAGTDVVPARRLWLAVLLGNLALGASLQALPALVVRRFDGGPVLVGFAVGMAFAATALCRPIAGYFADSGQARVTVFVGGLLAAVGGVGQLAAPDPALLLVARFLMGAGDAALFSGSLPWVLAGTPADRRGRVASWFGLSIWTGIAIGPVLATVLQYWFGDNAVWIAVIALGCAAALPVLNTPGQPSPAERASGGWRALVPRGVALPGTVLWLASYGYGTVGALAVLFLRQSHHGGDGVPLTVFAAGYVLVRVVGGRWIDRYGGEVVASTSLLVELAGLALVAASVNLLTTLAGLALAGMGVALVYPSTVTITFKRAGLLRAGASVGAMTSCWDIGIMVAGPLGGVLAAGVNYRFAFAFAAVLTGAAALLGRWMMTRPAVAVS
ncbi:MAG TPA: MFS transporter [Pseudonocardiaceae bacterium]|nr:MFS transporter [Pseudonocardiaceae bacterium]